MLKPFKLGYASFKTKNLGAMIAYYTEVMGFTLVEQTAGGAYISSGLDHHTIVLTAAESSELEGIGLQLDGRVSMAEVAKKLEALGVPYEWKTDSQPGISELVEMQDPAGNIVQLYSQMTTPAPGFKQTGIVPNKLGHIALCVQDPKKVVAFYQEVLGFQLTDWIGDLANFMTCNQDHHVLNIAASTRTKMHHIAFELRGASHQYASSDLLSRHAIPVLWGPSRHTAGHNIATYHYDPDQHVVELYTDMDLYLGELGYMEPRPWHKELPQYPKVWPVDSLTHWETAFVFDLGKI